MRDCPECKNAFEEGSRFCPFCGSAAAPGAPADPQVGRTVNGKFRIEAVLGQGGMGRVYRARHLTLDRPVVLKMLHAAYSGDPQIVQRFQREARAASRLNHPNSIAVLDFGEAEDGTLFMAMEYLPGRDLARLVEQEFPLAEARIVRIGAQILSALGEAHAQGVIHRDLKPENVMVEPRRDEPDFVKVLDFGIAKITAPGAGEPKLTQAGLVCGTPEYMSPEQARGAELDARSDLYSVGVILYQLATGDLPFSSDTPVGFLTKHLSEVPLSPRQRRPDLSISPALDALVSRALEKDPARRFESADEMRAALLACGARASAPATMAMPATPAASPAAPEPPRRRPRRRAFWLFAAAMAVAVLGGLLVVRSSRRSFESYRKEQAGIAEATARALAAAPPAPAAPATGPAAASPAPSSTTAAVRPEARGAAPETGGPRPTRPRRTATASLDDPDAEYPDRPDAGATGGAFDTRASRDGPERARSLLRRGDERRAEQDVAGAIRLYLRAERADPSLAEVHKKLALCYELEGDTARARARYRRYLATDPQDAEKVRAILRTLR